MRRLLLASTFVLGALPVLAQDREQTLADIRQELSVVYVEIQKLNRELSTTQGAGASAGGTTVLERLSGLEAEVQRLTAQTEQLEFRVGQVVRDGTNRIGNLEFRLCELETDCDISTLGDTPSLGGEVAQAPPPAALPPTSSDTGLAAGERGEFDLAKEAFDAAEYQVAAERFGTFAENYPGGPLTSEAHLLKGRSLEELGQMTDAARAYLDAFSGDTDGEFAPEALAKLGTSLGAIGQIQDACTTLAEVEVRFPGNAQVGEAQAAMASLNCQ
ncbi:tol-pal system protein YbgF [Aestuariibius insulae]|uniref:tol-pal system protein YbgF n=1 Tax=Aestuariibius insulae TaxID=2058287 RepID=UPI00345E7691